MEISGVMLVHNEEYYLPYSLNSLKDAPIQELIFILDRCTDKSPKIIESFKPTYKTITIIKNWKKWRSGTAESRELGFSLAKKNIIYGLDADIVFDSTVFNPDLFERFDIVSFGYNLLDPSYPRIHQECENFLRKFLDFSRFMRPTLGQFTGIYGIKKDVWKKVHFRDVISEHIDFLKRATTLGYKHHYVPSTKTLHLRTALHKNKQITTGRSRAEIGRSFLSTLLNSWIHLKPYVMRGYIQKRASAKRILELTEHEC